MINPSEKLQYEAPPYDQRLEQAIICTLLQDAECVAPILDKVRAFYFQKPVHQKVFEITSELVRVYGQVNLPLLFERISTVMDEMLVSYVQQMTAHNPGVIITANTIEHWIERITDYARRRHLWEVGTQFQELAFDKEEEKYMPVAQTLVQLVENCFPTEAPKDNNTLLQMALENSKNQLLAPGGVVGLSTGLRQLDGLITGLNPKKLYIIAAESGVGKTAMALNFVMDIVFKQKKPVLFFSLEVSADELYERAIKYKTDTFHTSEAFERSAIEIQQDVNLFIIDDRADITVSEIQAKTKNVLSKVPDLALVIVDYIGKIKMPDGGNKNQNRTYQVEENVWALKVLAKQLNVPVVALSQMNRDVQHRADKTPMLSDLRDSSAIGQDADVVMFVHRDANGAYFLTIAKQRNGPLGTIDLSYAGRNFKFKELQRSNYAEH